MSFLRRLGSSLGFSKPETSDDDVIVVPETVKGYFTPSIPENLIMSIKDSDYKDNRFTFNLRFVDNDEPVTFVPLKSSRNDDVANRTWRWSARVLFTNYVAYAITIDLTSHDSTFRIAVDRLSYKDYEESKYRQKSARLQSFEFFRLLEDTYGHSYVDSKPESYDYGQFVKVYTGTKNLRSFWDVDSNEFKTVEPPVSEPATVESQPVSSNSPVVVSVSDNMSDDYRSAVENLTRYALGSMGFLNDVPYGNKGSFVAGGCQYRYVSQRGRFLVGSKAVSSSVDRRGDAIRVQVELTTSPDSHKSWSALVVDGSVKDLVLPDGSSTDSLSGFSRSMGDALRGFARDSGSKVDKPDIVLLRDFAVSTVKSLSKS